MILDIKITILINTGKNNNKNKRLRGGALCYKFQAISCLTYSLKLVTQFLSRSAGKELSADDLGD